MQQLAQQSKKNGKHISELSHITNGNVTKKMLRFSFNLCEEKRVKTEISSLIIDTHK